MSLATHAMTKNAPVEAAPPSLNRNACMNGLTFNNMFKPSALGHTDALFAHGHTETPLPPHARFAHGQTWGQPWMPYSTASMPSVDMLVLPKTEQTNGQTQPSADSDVKDPNCNRQPCDFAFAESRHRHRRSECSLRTCTSACMTTDKIFVTCTRSMLASNLKCSKWTMALSTTKHTFES
jgi:hypothetical protein